MTNRRIIFTVALALICEVIINNIANETFIAELYASYRWFWLGFLLLICFYIKWYELRQQGEITQIKSGSGISASQVVSEQPRLPWWGWLCGLFVFLPFDLIPDFFIGIGQIDDVSYLLIFLKACWKCIKYRFTGWL